MARHTIDHTDLAEFSWGHEIAGTHGRDGSKSLLGRVQNDVLAYHVTAGGRTVWTGDTLKAAIDAYNETDAEHREARKVG